MDFGARRRKLGHVFLFVGAALWSRAARADGPSRPDDVTDDRRVAYLFSFDGLLRPSMGADNYTSLFRLALWDKDALLRRWEQVPRVPSIVFGMTRLVEFALLDVPLAISAQTYAHEIHGHGGRIREFGGATSYVFMPPFPYSMKTSYYTDPIFSRTPSDDEQILITQGGLNLEGYQRRQVLMTAFEAGSLSHGDAVLYFGWALHLAGYGALKGGDVTNWTSAMARKFGKNQQDLQRSYLISASIMELLDPLFLYSTYAMFVRFLVFGERRISTPGIAIRGVRFWLSSHLGPVPWGVEYQLDVLARTRLFALAVTPRLGAGPGGSSGGLTLSARGFPIARDVRLSAELDLWLQPELMTFSEGTVTATLNPPPAPLLPGLGGHVEVTHGIGPMLAGLRITAKTTGLMGVSPIAPALESAVRLGLRLQ